MNDQPDGQADAMRGPDDGPATEDDGDALTAVRARLEAVNELPVTERPEVFAEINAAVADELAAMDEV